MNNSYTFISTSVSPGNVPVYHGRRPRNPEILERRLKLAELILRALICGSCALSVFIIASDSQVKVIFSVREEAKFTQMKSFVFLVVVNGIMASYSLVQVVRCVMGMIRGKVLLSKPLACAIFSVDQAMAYLSFAAIAAALQSSAFGKLGQSEFQWIKVCDAFERYCNEGAGGVVLAVVGSLCAVATSLISAYGCFRLFGGNKGKVPKVEGGMEPVEAGSVRQGSIVM